MSNQTIWWGGERPDLRYLDSTCKQALPEHLGIEFIECGDDWLKARMPVDARTHQPYGRLHGGASVALAETVGSMAAAWCVDRGKYGTVGMEINANHVRPVREGWVYATARPEALGRSTQVWSIRIEDESGKLVCISRLTMAVITMERK